MSSINEVLEKKEEHLVWKRNSEFMYDRLFDNILDWPSLSVQWIPRRPTDDQNTQRLLLGTYTAEAEDTAVVEDNFLMMATLQQPLTKAKTDINDSTPRAPGKFEIVQKIVHDGEVNKARHMPQNHSIVASWSSNAKLYISNFNKPTETPIVLHGHTEEGYALSWNAQKAGQILTGGNDKLICAFELTDFSSKAYQPSSVYKGHTDIVCDVAWQPGTAEVFGSVGDDKKFMLWDSRNSLKPVQNITAHEAEVNCLAFNTFRNNLCLTGSSDKTVALWDVRKFGEPLHVFEFHDGEVFQVEWAPQNETFFMSGSADSRIHVWNVAEIGEQQNFEDAEDGPPELVFSHAGHQAKIEDFCWNVDIPWYVSSVDSNNTLQCWQLAKDTFDDSGGSHVNDSDLEE